MRPKENIEKFVRVRKPNVKTSRQMDKRTLDDSFAAMEQTIQAKSADHKPSTARIIILNRMIKLAAAAVIIIAISFFIVHQRPSEQAYTTKVSKVPKSTVEMVTARSLERAFRRGGIEAVEKQCDKALEMQKRPLDKLDIKELFTEIEIDLERTEL